MDAKTELIKLLLSFIEQETTAEQLKDTLEKLKPAHETNRLLNQINSSDNAEEIQSFVTATLNDLVK